MTRSVPLAVASALDYGVPVAAQEAFPDFQVVPKLVEACDCLPEEDCCDPGNPPALYKLDIDGASVYESETVGLLADPYLYQFTNVQSQSQGVCGQPRHIGWHMSLQP